MVWGGLWTFVVVVVWILCMKVFCAIGGIRSFWGCVALECWIGLGFGRGNDGG